MKRKIVFFIESLNLGGAEKSLVTLLKNLDETKYEIDLLTITENGFFKDELPSWVSYKKVNQKKISLFQRIKFFLIKKLKKKTHAAQLLWPIISKNYQKSDKVYDIAIAYGQGFPTYYVAEKVKANKKLCWINVDYEEAGYNKKLDSFFYKQYNSIVCVSDELSKKIKLIFPEFKDKITVVKDITDENEIRKKSTFEQKYKFSGDKINLVTVCRLSKEKGLKMAIKASSVLIKKGFDINWYIIGEGSQRNELENLIKENNLENHFHILGADPNPYPYIKNCDIYVQTSLFEGLGLTVIEAAILHKPIVCTNFPTAYSILKDGETGLIVEMDSEEIAAGIEKLIKDEQLRNKLITNLSNQENTDKEITLKKFEELIGGNE